MNRHPKSKAFGFDYQGLHPAIKKTTFVAVAAKITKPSFHIQNSFRGPAEAHLQFASMKFRPMIAHLNQI